jgi:arsenite-transporting ATPase
MLTGITDPLLRSRAQAEMAVILTIKTTYAERVFGIPFISEQGLLNSLLNKHIEVTLLTNNSC